MAIADRDPKKSKMVKEPVEEEGEKLGLFQRLWSEDDEVTVLKGILDYKEQNGSDPMKVVNYFLAFIKSSAHVNVDRKQLQDKVRRLKDKFYNRTTGKNPFETELIELSNKIWGQTVEGNLIANITKASKNTATTKTAGKANISVNFLGKKSVAMMGLDDATVAAELGMCSEDRKFEIEKKSRKLHVEERILLIKKLDLVREESEMEIAALIDQGTLD